MSKLKTKKKSNTKKHRKTHKRSLLKYKGGDSPIDPQIVEINKSIQDVLINIKKILKNKKYNNGIYENPDIYVLIKLANRINEYLHFFDIETPDPDEMYQYRQYEVPHMYADPQNTRQINQNGQIYIKPDITRYEAPLYAPISKLESYNNKLLQEYLNNGLLPPNPVTNKNNPSGLAGW